MSQPSHTTEHPRPRRQRGVTVKVRVLDRRTKESATYRETVDSLTKHLGGQVSATQRCLIERAAMLTVHLARLDKRSLEAGAMSETDAKSYLAWTGTMVRTMAQLGLQGAKQKPPTPAEMVAARHARARAGVAA